MKHKSILAIMIIVTVIFIQALWPAAAKAATMTYDVTRFDDTTGPCISGNCSLRAAIIAANSNPGHDTINLPPGVYTLSLTGVEGGQSNNPNLKDLDILEGVTINGTAGNPATTIIQAGTTPSNGIGRVFDIVMDNTGGKDISTTIQNVTIRHGRESGATTFYAGGAIQFYAQSGPGNLHVYNSILNNNSAAAGGGAISAANNSQPGAFLWIDHTAITNNIAGDPTIGTLGGSGGAIEAGYELGIKIDDSLIQGNTTNHGTASTGQGGGIWYWQDPTSGVASYIKNTVIDGNHAVGVGYAGGGGAFIARPITITSSTVSNNTADDYGGGLVLSAGNGDVHTLANVSISGNSTKTYGGGVYLSHVGSTYNFVNVTVTNNRSDSDNTGTSLGGAEVDSGGGIRRQTSPSSGTFNIYNTIIDGNFKGSGSNADDIDAKGTVFTGTNNLVGTTISGGLNSGSNQLNVADPRLDTLKDNGTAGGRAAWLGPIKTHAILSDSMALDSGNNTYLTSFGLNLTTDARGLGWNRVLDAADQNTTATVDIGALEMHPSVADTGPVTMLQDTTSNANVYVGDISVGIISLTAVSSDPAILPNPSINGPGATRTLMFSPAPGKSGKVTVTLTATQLYNGVTQSMTDTQTVTIVPRPDLAITKTHTNPWKQGDTGKTYTLTVSNAASAGPTLAAGNAFSIAPKVTVTDNLPAGLTATAMSGTGWSCTLGTLTCDRSDVLAAGAAYPAITVTVNVAANANSTVTNSATVSGNADNSLGNNSATDSTTIISTNANLSGLGLTPGTLSPDFSSGITSYTANVVNSVTSVSITPTVADSTATVKVNGTAVASGSPGTVAINVGSNTIPVLVTAQDGTTQKTYTVTVTRQTPSTSTPPALIDIDIVNNLAPTADTVTVKQLNADDVIKVYDSATGGNLLSTATVPIGQTTVTASVYQLGTAAGQVYVSVTSTGATESSRTAKAYEAEPTVDTIAPITKYHFDPIYDKTSSGKQYIKGYTTTLRATDNVSGSGVNNTQYRINGGTWTTYTAPFTIFAGTTHTVEYFSTDNAGNVENPINLMDFDNGKFIGAGKF